MPVADLLEITGRKHNEWSIPRKGRQNETPLVGDATTPIINKKLAYNWRKILLNIKILQIWHNFIL